MVFINEYKLKITEMEDACRLSIGSFEPGINIAWVFNERSKRGKYSYQQQYINSKKNHHGKN